MRSTFFIVSVAVVFGVTGSARAQGTSSRIWGGAPKEIKFTPIDTSKAMAPSNVNKAFHRPNNAMNTGFSASNFFPKISLGTWPPQTPQVSVLPQSQNPFQPNLPKGGIISSNYLPGFKK